MQWKNNLLNYKMLRRLLLVVSLLACVFDANGKDIHLNGFVKSRYFNEQVAEFVYEPGMKVHINAPSAKKFDRAKPTRVVLYALPNGNSTECTIGKLPSAGDDWHFHIQHIGAQTRYIRSADTSVNHVTVYLEAPKKSWGAWRKVHNTSEMAAANDAKSTEDAVAAGDAKSTDKAVAAGDAKIKELVEYILGLFAEYNPYIELNSHSGGGNFIFGFLDACEQIPSYIKGISFLDSNYNWDDVRYGGKLASWLAASAQNRLFVACYDDANALLDGKPFVSRKGGTWYRSNLMRKYLGKSLKIKNNYALGKSLKLKKQETDSSICYSTPDSRIYIYFQKNPLHKIYHTVLVERNGFIHSVLAGAAIVAEGDASDNAGRYTVVGAAADNSSVAGGSAGYKFMGERAYDEFRQDSVLYPRIFPFMPRRKSAEGFHKDNVAGSGTLTGSGFAEFADKMGSVERDSLVYKEIVSGNIPQYLRQPFIIKDTLEDAQGVKHEVELSVTPDFLAVGSDSDYMRIPMLPGTAQRLADRFGAVLPTRKLSDLIHKHATIKLVPHPMTPDATMITLAVFARHNAILDNSLVDIGYNHRNSFSAYLSQLSGKLCDIDGNLLAGHKKDIVITNRMAGETGRLYIYGYHYPSGKIIQPLTGVHYDGYVDYSHGVRLVCDQVLVDGKRCSLKKLLQDPVLYALFSDEDGPMQVVGYPQ